MKLISGMHRSGTSMMARLCFEAGGNMGNPETFYQGDQWNPDGYFEQSDIHDINFPLVNGRWGKLSYFKLSSTETILKRSDKISELIKKTSTKYKGKIIKETRFCLTIPGWVRHDAKIEKILVCLRNPIQVASSIKKRNKTILRHGLELWYTHNHRILENAQDIPIWFVSYNDLLEEKTSFSELKKAFEFLDLKLTDERILKLKSEFIKTKMNNNPNTEYDYPNKIKVLWDKLQKLHSQQNLFSVS